MSFTQAIIKNATRSLSVIPKATATVITDGYLLVWASGLAVLADTTATIATIAGVANGSIAAADVLAQVSKIDIFKQDVWIVASTNNSDASHDGQAMIVGANAGTINNTGTTSAVGVVQQVGVYGATTDKKILVRFL